MPIPNNEAINEFLGSLTIDEPSSPEAYDRFEVIPAAQVSDGRSTGISKSLWVWYERSCKMSASAMIERLRHKGHRASKRTRARSDDSDEVTEGGLYHVYNRFARGAPLGAVGRGEEGIGC